MRTPGGDLFVLARRRMRDEGAQTLIELIVVMAILTVVLAPISSSFVSSLNHETRQTSPALPRIPPGSP